MTFFKKAISSLYKIRKIEDIPEKSLTDDILLRGEHFSVQLVMYSDTPSVCRITPILKDEAGNIYPQADDRLKLYRVQNVIMDYPIYADHDEDILTDEAGLMPDLLTPIGKEDNLLRMGYSPVSVLLSLDTPRDIPAGKYTLDLILDYYCSYVPDDMITETVSVSLEIIDAALPAQSVHFTEWFHVDSIAEAYSLPVYSEEHWEMIDKYMRLARYLGIDTILTPILTPALDTAVGTERLKVQLVKIEKKNGKFYFDFSDAERYINLARKNGIEHFEISHIYSQWGLSSSPNIYVWEDGVERRMFDFSTDAHGEEYREFVSALLPALTGFLKQIGVYENSYFHLSDEPNMNHLEKYKNAHDLVKPYIPDRPIMDALSDFDFYGKGLLDIPVTATDHLDEFIDAALPEQWAYYCCAQYKKVGNRFLSFPAYRNRILGIQLYKYGIKGFLQWGFNFYHSEGSLYVINPYLTTSADHTFPSGDAFSVYPGESGPNPTLRALVFKDSLEDIEVLRALEEKTSHSYVVELIEKIADGEITFKDYPRNYDFIPDLMKEVKKELNNRS